MFYPCDFEIKRNKEQEIRERVQQAETERLLESIKPYRASWFARTARGATHWLGHTLLGVGHRLEALGDAGLFPKQQISSR